MINQSSERITERNLIKPEVDRAYLINTLKALLDIPSPSGYTDSISRFVCEELVRLGMSPELTRRGAIRVTLKGKRSQPNRALVGHLDTIGAMVRTLKSDGRLAIGPIGTWSSRFAEGARVTIFTDRGHQRGTIVPLCSSGHAYGDAVDELPVTWDHIEVRVDGRSRTGDELYFAGFRVGDFVAIDPSPEFLDNGFIVSRHLDDKAGVACMLTAAKIVRDAGLNLSIDCHLLLTIFEEVGSGASGVLHRDIAEMVSVDNAVLAPNQNSSEHGVTVAMMDSFAPFDYHLTHRLIDIASRYNLRYRRDVFRYYRSDAASAVSAGNDIRTALVCFGVDASHGYERTHIDSLVTVIQLLVLYMQSDPAVERDKDELADLSGFPEQHVVQPPIPEKRAPDTVGMQDDGQDP